ncbi:hypothetical protein [Gehongia tenuis]|uniref:Uncharacterized protein n=1 Tax=Gehongia tenuis TaxID=2763655 RepID=A0A926D3C7_9FIRM|nr:hypothetical protein [Gehongia tenuis]MBC8530548.1 hypothetical protein [Gehongia tenuis]
MKKIVALIMVVGMFAMALTACGGTDAATPSPEATPSAAATPAPTPEATPAPETTPAEAEVGGVSTPESVTTEETVTKAGDKYEGAGFTVTLPEGFSGTADEEGAMYTKMDMNEGKVEMIMIMNTDAAGGSVSDLTDEQLAQLGEQMMGASDENAESNVSRSQISGKDAVKLEITQTQDSVVITGEAYMFDSNDSLATVLVVSSGTEAGLSADMQGVLDSVVIE